MPNSGLTVNGSAKGNPAVADPYEPTGAVQWSSCTDSPVSEDS